MSLLLFNAKRDDALGKEGLDAFAGKVVAGFKGEAIRAWRHTSTRAGGNQRQAPAVTVGFTACVRKDAINGYLLASNCGPFGCGSADG